MTRRELAAWITGLTAVGTWYAAVLVLIYLTSWGNPWP